MTELGKKLRKPKTKPRPSLPSNYLKTEAHAKLNWFKAQPMGVKNLNDIMKDMTTSGGGGRKTFVKKLQDIGVKFLSTR